jgi:hypothetical protein
MEEGGEPYGGTFQQGGCQDAHGGALSGGDLLDPMGPASGFGQF